MLGAAGTRSSGSIRNIELGAAFRSLRRRLAGLRARLLERLSRRNPRSPFSVDVRRGTSLRVRRQSRSFSFSRFRSDFQGSGEAPRKMRVPSIVTRRRKARETAFSAQVFPRRVYPVQLAVCRSEMRVGRRRARLVEIFADARAIDALRLAGIASHRPYETR